MLMQQIIKQCFLLCPLRASEVCVCALFGISSSLRGFSVLDDIYNFSQKKHAVEHFKVSGKVYSHNLA